jgi:hypothetical protein
LWIAHSPAELIREHRALSRRIDHDASVEFPDRAVIHLYFDADSAVAVEQDVLYGRFLIYGHPLLSGMVEQHLIEDGTRHLPGDRALMMICLEEIKRARLFSLRVCELHAVFADEVARPELFQEPHPLE